MAVLVGVVLGLGGGLALLYYWLQAHWFARVVVFLLLALVLGAAGGAITSTPQVAEAAIPGAVCGATLAWFIAGIPTYYWRWRIKQPA